jgi:hypothetical protein
MVGMTALEASSRCLLYSRPASSGLCQPGKALISDESIHYQYSCERNGWITGSRGREVLWGEKRQQLEGDVEGQIHGASFCGLSCSSDVC